MNGVLHLTLSYLRYHRIRTCLLILALTLTLFLPLILNQLIHQYEHGLTKRAEATPMVVGARGDRYDLVLNSLYFTTSTPSYIPFGEVTNLTATGHGAFIPLHVKYTAQDHPVVGTPLEYFNFRDLSIAAGTLPLRIGDCVLGANAAERLGLAPGDRLLTDQVNLFNIAAAYPLKMQVTGVLAVADSPDDDAVFVDLKTAWIIEGLAHGHQEVKEDTVLSRENQHVRANAALVEYNQITPDNVGDFHLHGDPADFPITSIIAVPHSPKSATLLKAAYNTSETRQILVSREVVTELLGMVFRVKRFFDANFLLVTVSTTLFVGIVVMLSLRLREREMQTMFKLGCARSTVALLQATEWMIILFSAAVIAWLLALLTLRLTPIWQILS